MNRDVPFARRTLFEDRRRAVLALGGVGSGLLLVLLMSGIFAGFTRQESAYMDQSPADVIISQAGVNTMQMSTSALPAGTLDQVVAVPGVAWAVPLRQMTSTVTAGGTQLVAYVFGYETTGGQGGPQQLHAGRRPAAGEILLDRAGADQLRVTLGDTVEVFGTKLVVSGLTSGLTSVASTSVFMTADQYAALAGAGTNYVLVGRQPGVTAEELAARLAEHVPAAHAQTRFAFSEQESKMVQDMYTDVIQTMNAIGFVIALALVALTLSAVTSANLREYGVVKALGATRVHLGRAVATQAVWAILAASVIATVCSLLLAALVNTTVPNISVIIEPRSVLTTLLGALIVGAPAALLPLRRVLAVDPASAFRGAT